MKKHLFTMNFRTGLTAAFAGLALCFLFSCGTGGKTDPGDQRNSGMSGDRAGTGNTASTGYETADNTFNSDREGYVGDRNYPGEIIRVAPEDAMHGSSSIGTRKQGGRPATQFANANAELRLRQTLLSADPKNRSRIGQSLRADNPEKIGEFSMGDSPASAAAGGTRANENGGVPLNANTESTQSAAPAEKKAGNAPEENTAAPAQPE